MACREQILSDQTYDYITDFPIENTGDLTPVVCYESIDDAYNIVYLNRNLVPNPETDFFEYQSIPKLYGLMQQEGGETTVGQEQPQPGGFTTAAQPQPFDPTALVASGIRQVQDQPLNLTGRGTLICFIDTGIDYTNPVFRDELGDTRIEAIWDQTDQTGEPPEGFLYGTEYTREQINAALRSSDPRSIVPVTDEIGHGTALASVAAGTAIGAGAFSGAAPFSTDGINPLGARPVEGTVDPYDIASIRESAGQSPANASTPAASGPQGLAAALAPSNSQAQSDAPSPAASGPQGLAATPVPSPRVSSVPSNFRGAAPEAGIVVVKLKPAKAYLRNFFLLPAQAAAYQENDIMLAVKYCDQFAQLFRRPVIICIGLGTSYGDHNGSSALSTYLNTIAVKRNRAVVVCGGNEGNSAHHFRGYLNQNAIRQAGGSLSGGASAVQSAVTQEVEVRVAEGNGGFILELWGKRPDVLNISIRSPGGEVIPPVPLGLRQSITYGFIYERTQITVDTTLVEPSSGDELILLRFVQPTPGIWTVRVISQGEAQNGVYDVWLPIAQFQQSAVYFLRPNPDITLTEPAMASEVISVSAYNPANAAFYIDSGRGFSRNGFPKPDLAAPGVDISTVSGKYSGTSYAAALTAGAAAQFFQWAVVEGNNLFAESREIKSYLIRGAKRDPDISYPSKEWGYGRLDMIGVFTSLRV